MKLRRELHAYPELSMHEIRTSEIVCAELEKVGIPFTRLKDNCVVGVLTGYHPGKRLAIRADMDALPITEENDLSYKSQNNEVMHACGHDGHTAMLLGVARLLSEYRESLCGTVYFCFQSAEETGGGADVILEFLESQGRVDQAIAVHLMIDIPSGKISLSKGARLAAADGFDIEIIGKGGHGSRPDQCIDPLKPTATILLNLFAIPVNRYKPTEPLVVHVCKFQGGILRNIFLENATLSGQFRYFSNEARQTAHKVIREIAENGARMYGAEARLTFIPGPSPVNNDAEAVDFGPHIISEMNELELIESEPFCGSENFANYLEKFKEFMAFIGIRNEGKDIVNLHHHPRFDIDESVLIKGTEFFVCYAANFLQGT